MHSRDIHTHTLNDRVRSTLSAADHAEARHHGLAPMSQKKGGGCPHQSHGLYKSRTTVRPRSSGHRRLYPKRTDPSNAWATATVLEFQTANDTGTEAQSEGQCRLARKQWDVRAVHSSQKSQRHLPCISKITPLDTSVKPQQSGTYVPGIPSNATRSHLPATDIPVRCQRF
jgi:hypothetical protein